MLVLSSGYVVAVISFISFISSWDKIMRDPHKMHILFWVPHLKLRWGQICEGESLAQRLGGNFI